MSENGVSSHNMRKTVRTVVGAVLVLLCLAGIGGSAFFYSKYQASQNTEQARQKSVLASIGQTIALPSGGSTAVTIADKTKLGNKALAARVENRDILFIFGQAKRIIVYRPSTKKVVDMLTFASSTDLPKSQTGTAGASTSQPNAGAGPANQR